MVQPAWAVQREPDQGVEDRLWDGEDAVRVLAYNVGRLFVLSTLDISWHRHQVQTLRWKLYERAGKIVLHGGYIYLKVSRSVQKLFEKVRLRSWEFAHA